MAAEHLELSRFALGKPDDRLDTLPGVLQVICV